MGRREYRRPRQEISRCLKYLIFFTNFIFWICGITCTILGVYLYAKDFRAVLEAIDFFLNPSILLIICGCIIFVVAFLGCTGALRENVCMLKAFSLFLFFSYVSLVILAFVVFIFFYSDTRTGVSIQTLLHTAVNKYHNNENMRELMDYLQSTLGCCGASSQGYKDWNNNQLYNCSPSNLAPEQCGVPPSCCKPKNNSPVLVSPPVPPTAAAPAEAGNLEAMLENYANPRCGFHMQDKAITDLQNVLYTDGCLQPLQRAFEANAVVIGAVIGSIIVPVCVSVTLSNILARQVERQKYLLAREARKEEKRRRRNKSKHKEMLALENAQSGTILRIEGSSHRQGPKAAKKPKMEGEYGRKISNQSTSGLYKHHSPLVHNQRVSSQEPIYEKVKKRTKKSTDKANQKRRTSATPRGRAISDQPCVNRSRSEDPNLVNYKGPIIVELPS